MKHVLAILLTSVSLAAGAQAESERVQYDGYAAEPFGAAHTQLKQREQLAIGLRVQTNLRVANARREEQYAENRRRCQAALRVAAACGRYAGTFACDERGFRPTPVDASAKHAVISSGDRYRMERCALDAAGRDP